MIIKNPEGKLLGFINWFGVHCTSISSYNTRIHYDNKGVAAHLFEKLILSCIGIAPNPPGPVQPPVTCVHRLMYDLFPCAQCTVSALEDDKWRMAQEVAAVRNQLKLQTAEMLAMQDALGGY